MRKLFLTFCAVSMLLTGIMVLSACGKSIPQFEGNPISASGSLRLDGYKIYLDITITNNSDKNIKKIRATSSVATLMDGGADWCLSGANSGDFPDADVGKFKTLKSGASRTYSIYTCCDSEWGRYNPENDTTEWVVLDACKVSLSVYGIEFGSYGYMGFSGEDEFEILSVEWHK